MPDRRDFLRGCVGSAAALVVGLAPKRSRALYRPYRSRRAHVIHATGDEYRFPWSEADRALSVQVNDWLWAFRRDVDVTIVWPNRPLDVEAFSVIGGQNVRVIGGEFLARRTGGAAVALANQTRPVFVEGAHVDCRGHERDGIVLRWDGAIAKAMGITRKTHPGITMQRCRIEGVTGTFATLHGDCYQSQCIVDQIRLEECTLESGYQAIFPLAGPPPRGPTRGLMIRKVNVRWNQGGGSKGFIAAYFHDGDRAKRTSGLYPIRLSDFWAGEMSDGFVWEERVASPHVLHSWGPPLGRDKLGEFLDFSRTKLRMTGRLRRGQPPGGDFAPANSVGVNYRSRWGL